MLFGAARLLGLCPACVGCGPVVGRAHACDDPRAVLLCHRRRVEGGLAAAAAEAATATRRRKRLRRPSWWTWATKCRCGGDESPTTCPRLAMAVAGSGSCLTLRCARACRQTELLGKVDPPLSKKLATLGIQPQVCVHSAARDRWVSTDSDSRSSAVVRVPVPSLCPLSAQVLLAVDAADVSARVPH